MTDKPDPPEHHVDDALNALGPAGQNADPFVDRPVSGLPAGGPHDLGLLASEAMETEHDDADDEDSSEETLPESE